MDRNELRRLVNKAAKTYADRYRLPHYLSRSQTEPTVLFSPDQDALLHGNFLNASYDAICSNPEWALRLYKPHSRRRALPAEHCAKAMEFDSCTSSYALLMNVFGYPGLFLHDPFVRLMGLPATAEPDLVFGFETRVPLRRSGTDATEVDLKIEDMLIEAKLTENDFIKKRSDVVERWRDSGYVFESSSLPTQDGHYLQYQLIRNVLAAYHLVFRFRLICDARRYDSHRSSAYRLVCRTFPQPANEVLAGIAMAGGLPLCSRGVGIIPSRQVRASLLRTACRLGYATRLSLPRPRDCVPRHQFRYLRLRGWVATSQDRRSSSGQPSPFYRERRDIPFVSPLNRPGLNGPK